MPGAFVGLDLARSKVQKQIHYLPVLIPDIAMMDGRKHRLNWKRNLVSFLLI